MPLKILTISLVILGGYLWKMISKDNKTDAEFAKIRQYSIYGLIISVITLFKLFSN